MMHYVSVLVHTGNKMTSNPSVFSNKMILSSYYICIYQNWWIVWYAFSSSNKMTWCPAVQRDVSYKLELFYWFMKWIFLMIFLYIFQCKKNVSLTVDPLSISAEVLVYTFKRDYCDNNSMTPYIHQFGYWRSRTITESNEMMR